VRRAVAFAQPLERAHEIAVHPAFPIGYLLAAQIDLPLGMKAPQACALLREQTALQIYARRCIAQQPIVYRQ
jgi:hypothetical protein